MDGSCRRAYLARCTLRRLGAQRLRPRGGRTGTGAGCAPGLLTVSAATAQQSAATTQGSDTNDELAQNFAAEHEIGHRYHFGPNDLPPPKTGPIVADRSLIVPFNGQKLEVPPGFTAAPFVTGLVNPQRPLVLPNGDVLVAEQSAG